jgi:addiction module RelB/DinJ family antitoxin
MLSTVRINPKIKEEVTPILSELGISLSEAINMFLHQIKLNNGIPFELKRKGIIELNDGYGSYVCEYGHIHDYSKKDLKELDKDISNKTYVNAEEMMKDILDED